MVKQNAAVVVRWFMGMSMRWLVLLALVGCAREPVVLTVEQGASIEAVRAAVAEWVEVCGADVSVGAGGVPVAVTDEGVPSDSDAFTLAPGGELAWIHVRPGHVADRALLAHEIGHALGHRHTATGIMTAGNINDAHVTEGDCR